MSLHRPIRSAAAAAGVVAVLGLLSSACTTNPEVAKREYVKSGDRFVEQQKYREAIVQYRNALQKDPQFGEARLKLAETYEKIGDATNAFRENIRAADALPDDAKVQVKAGFYLLAAGQFEDARSRALKALKKDPKNVEAQVLLGDSLAGLNDFEAALRQLEEAIRIDPKSADAYQSVGIVQTARGSKEDAEAAFRKAVQTDPKFAGGHLALANFLWSIGRPAEAEASFKEAIGVDPGNLVANRALAMFYIATGRAPLAEPHLKVLADGDKSAAAPMKLALADYYFGINRVDDAVKVLESLASQSGSALPPERGWPSSTTSARARPRPTGD